MTVPVRRPRGRILAAGLVVAAAAAVTTGLAAPAHADPPTFTWSGADEIANGVASFSDPANWAGGVAPTAGAPVALDFPAQQCVVDRTCSAPNNDIDGLVLSSLTIVEPNEDYNPQSAFGYTIGGDAVTVSGPVTASAPAAANSAVVDLGLHLQLTSPATLLVTDVQVAATDVAGKKLAVTIHGGSVDFDGTWALQTLSVKNTGDGTNLYAGDIDGTSKGTITNQGGPAFVIPSTLGSFAVKKTQAVFFDGTTTVHGKLSFDKKSTLGLSFSSGTDPTDYPNVTATKAVALGNVRVSPTVDCDVADGTSYTVFTGSSVSGVLDDATGHPVADGGTLATGAGNNCDGVSQPQLEVTYGATTVTLTVVSNGGDGQLRTAARSATRSPAIVHGVAITR